MPPQSAVPDPKSGAPLSTEASTELSRLLAPMSPETFLREHWGRKPLFLKATPEKRAWVQGLMDRDSFHRALKQGQQRRSQRQSQFHIRAMFPSQGGGWMNVVEVEPHQANAMLEAGANVCAHDISDGDERLAALAYALKQQLHFPGEMRFSCYVSPDGHGLKPHFDAQAVMALQLEGSKTWFFSKEPAVQSPAANGLLLPDGTVEWSEEAEGDVPFEEVPTPDLGSFAEAKLEPGDVLYVPAGTWHSTQAAGSSMGIVLYFSPLPLSNLLEQALWLMGESHPEWRSGPPAAVLSASTQNGQMPPEVRDYFAHRLAELRGWLENLDPGGLPLQRVWKRFIAQGPPPRMAKAGAAPRTVERQDMLSIDAGRPLSYAAGKNTLGEESVHLFCGEEELTLGAGAGPFIQHLVSQHQFKAEEALRWGTAGAAYDWEQVQSLLQLLVDQGILLLKSSEPGREAQEATRR
ncbi:MAG: JmjC domain-containing protein [Hyalangium sp.]|uniref:JmjC domain-containing protein n=1 Tax=Hyalangium sp. TaxID=2028555 RepID=UPI00389989CF